MIRTLGQANLVSSLLAGTSPQIIIRSQLTPEITIDLANLLAGKPKDQTFQSDGNSLFMSLMKPELIVSAAGVQKSIAPYGEPTQDFKTLLVAGSIGMAAIGASIAYWICRRK